MAFHMQTRLKRMAMTTQMIMQMTRTAKPRPTTTLKKANITMRLPVNRAKVRFISAKATLFWMMHTRCLIG